jgi:signal transduction histidine kinase
MSKNVLIVDRQTHRRDFLVKTLSGIGLSAHAYHSYDYTPGLIRTYGSPPDLVILSCKEITEDERSFIGNVLTENCLLIVLCDTLQWKDSRFLLLANPYNLKGDPSDSDGLIELIEEGFLSMYYKSALREAHHLGSGLGLVQLYVSNIREILKNSNIVNTAIEEELSKVINDVKAVLNRSKGMQKRATEPGRETPTQEIVMSVSALLEQSRWALPSPPANIELTFELQGDLAKVRVIVGQIMDILRNLIENAIEAMVDKGGTIVIRASNDFPHVKIEVVDTGPGIPSEYQAKIFTMFFSTKKSSGFGLWEARKFARKNHGTLTFNSRPGQGSTFILRLPMVVEVTG